MAVDPSADVLAAGTVLWRDEQVALVHRPRYDDWSLPKGKLDRGESLAACAMRETWEETGIRCRLGPRLVDVRYTVPEGEKLVRYWAGETLADSGFEPNAEVDELRWLPVEEASALLTHPHDRAVLERFHPPAHTMLLVRHAKAGSRRAWDGDDDLRPLSGVGRAQAAHFVDFLSLFTPDRLHSAVPVRCVDTIAPYAAKVGSEIVREPLLGEQGYLAEPEAGMARLRELAAQPGVTLLCSQGGVIPDALGTLLDEAGITPELPGESTAVPSRKGSTWLLTFGSAGTLATADYYPTPL